MTHYIQRHQQHKCYITDQNWDVLWVSFYEKLSHQENYRLCRHTTFLPVNQGEVLSADSYALWSYSDSQPLSFSVPHPVPLHPIMLQQRHQLQGLVLNRGLAHTLQSLVLGYDTAKNQKRHNKSARKTTTADHMKSGRKSKKNLWKYPFRISGFILYIFIIFYNII